MNQTKTIMLKWVNGMKKAVLLLLFIVVFIATVAYQEDPCHYKKQFQRQMKKYRKNIGCWQDYLHDMMPF